VKPIVRHSCIIFPIIAIFICAFALITINLNDKNAALEALSSAIDDQVELIRQTPTETLLNGALLQLSSSGLERVIGAANNHLERKIDPIAEPEALSSGAYLKLESAKRLWEALQDKARGILIKKAEIAKERENFLRLMPQLKQSTQELAQIMETRSVTKQMALDAKKQVDLVERFAFLAAEYIAEGGNQHYKELTQALETYSQTLYGFANEDKLRATALALVGSNQLFWRDYQASLSRAIETRRETIEDMSELYKDGETIIAAYSSAKAEIASDAATTLFCLRVAQIVSAALMCLAIGYAIGLFTHLPSEESPKPQQRQSFSEEPIDI
jgi:phosphate/sulfate permease